MLAAEQTVAAYLADAPRARLRWTARREPPREPAFDGVVASHAIVLADTAPVRAYLDGVTSADLDGQLVRDHHAAGLRRVLDASVSEPHGRIAADLGPLPVGMAWADLYMPEGLKRFLAVG